MVLVNLQHQRLQEVPDTLAERDDVTTIDVLSLNQNYLKSLSPSLKALTSLHTLYLGANCLKTVPDLSCVPQLHTLYLNNNLITSIVGSTLAKLTNLKRLDLRQNKLTSSEGLPSAPQLEWLSLSCNQIVMFTMPHYPNLKFLGLFGNHIRDGAQIVRLTETAPQIERLDLRYTPVTRGEPWAQVEPVLREKCRELRYLNDVDLEGGKEDDEKPSRKRRRSESAG